MGELDGLLWALATGVPLLTLAVWLDVKRRRQVGGKPARGPGEGNPGYLTQSKIDDLPASGIRRLALRTEPRDKRLEIGLADPEFADMNGRVDLKDANVLVIDGTDVTMRELMIPISWRQPLMLVARGISEGVLAALVANRKSLTTPLAAAIAGLIPEIADLTGALPVPIANLRVGYLPAGYFGHATRWITGGARIWIEPHPPLVGTT